jgi:hypothetical protein
LLSHDRENRDIGEGFNVRVKPSWADIMETRALFDDLALNVIIPGICLESLEMLYSWRSERISNVLRAKHFLRMNMERRRKIDYND